MHDSFKHINWAATWNFQQCDMCDQQSLRSACAYTQSDQSLCSSLEYYMNVKLLTEYHFEFLSLKGGCTSSSESTLVKMPHNGGNHVLWLNWISMGIQLFSFFACCIIFHDYLPSAEFFPNRRTSDSQLGRIQIRPDVLQMLSAEETSTGKLKNVFVFQNIL